MFSEIQVFKCFLCTCVANDAGHEANGSPPQELDAKQLVYIYMYVYTHYNLKLSVDLQLLFLFLCMRMENTANF